MDKLVLETSYAYIILYKIDSYYRGQLHCQTILADIEYSMIGIDSRYTMIAIKVLLNIGLLWIYDHDSRVTCIKKCSIRYINYSN